MADNNIVYKITVDSESGTASIRNLKGQIVATQVPVNKLKENFNDLTVSINSNKNATDGNVVAHKNSEFALNAEISKLNSLRSALDISSKEYQEMGNTIDLLNQKKASLKRGTEGLVNANGMLKNSSGAAASAAMELGRVISDAPYGIRGMANNITQLVSQLGFATTAAGGFRAAMKQMWTALMGPLGVVLAITTVVSALDYFSGSQKKAKKETDKTTKSLKKQITPLNKLVNLYSSLRKVLFTSKDNEAINAFNNNFLSLDETVKVLTRNFSEFKNAYDKLSDDDKKDKDKVKALVDGYSELLKLRELEEKQVARMSVLRDDVDKKGRTISRNGLTFLREEAKELNNLEKSYIDTQKELIKLENYFSKSQEDKEDRPEADILQDLYGIDTSDKSRQEYLDKLTEMFDFSDIDFNKQFEERLKLLDLSKQLGLITSEQYEQYRKDLDKEFSQHHVVTGIAPELDFTLSEGTRKGIEEYNKSVRDEILSNARLEEYEEYAKKLQNILGSISDFINSEYDRQLTIEQNKTNALNEELNNRLLNEQLSADQRKNIQNQIYQNDEALRVKQEAIKKKAFNAEKAFNISSALLETYAAASSAFRNTLANPLNKLLPDAGLLRAKVNAGIATASGLVQVAAIARQKYQSSSAATPIRTGSGGGASGGAGVGDRSFNFNLVGNTLGNQITDAIQGQFDQPLKAYVVSRDITSQQALDANIKGTASF